MDAASFASAIAAINSDTAGGLYTITLTYSFTIDSVTFNTNAAKTVTLTGKARPTLLRTA